MVDKGSVERRFRVGLSYPGEYGPFVAEVAQHLADKLGKDRVFYDKYYEAELALPNLDTYLQAIYHDRCDLVVVFICEVYKTKDWCGLELRAIRDRIKQKDDSAIMLVRLDEGDVPGLFSIDGYVLVNGRGGDEIAQLILERLAPNNKIVPSPVFVKPTIRLPDAPQREREMAYLDQMLNSSLRHVDPLYVALKGDEVQHRSLEKFLPTPMPTRLEFRSCKTDEPTHRDQDKTHYDNILDAFHKLAKREDRHLAVLGEPGAGKTFSLNRIALEAAQKAKDDPAAPVPLYIPLGGWINESQPLGSFIQEYLGPLGGDFQQLLRDHRSLLLLDALNEIPTGQRAHKAKQVKQLVHSANRVGIVVTCRERDFKESFALPLDTLTIRPLEPVKIRDFIDKYLTKMNSAEGEARAEALFWQIAGGEEVRDAWLAWQEAGADFASFWSAEEIPRKDPDVYSKTSRAQDSAWHRTRGDTRSLLHLARNPYLLRMIVELFLAGGGRSLPTNRAHLFADFVHNLCEREAEARDRRGDASPERETIDQALRGIAHTLQQSGGMDESRNVQTALPVSSLPAGVGEDTIRFARDANLLTQEADRIGFPHQLLQEYFSALSLKQAMRHDGLQAV